MLDKTVNTLENVFSQLSFGRFLFLLLLVVLCLYFYDLSTGYLFYTRIDKRISALERLQTLNQTQIDSSVELSRYYHSIITELNHEPSGSEIKWAAEPLIKFLAATYFPIIFAIVGLVKLFSHQPDGASIFIGAVVMTILLGIPAILIPTGSSL